MHQQLEIHVPVQPTPAALTRLRYLAASLEMYGGHLGGSSLVVSVGADEEPRDLDAELPWARSLPISWRWVDRQLYRRWGAAATSLARFTHDFEARHVLMLESDILVVAPLGSLVGKIIAERALGGVPAEDAPHDLLALDGGLEPPSPVYDPAVLIAPQRLMRVIGEGIEEEFEATAAVEPDWRIAATVARAVRRRTVPTLDLPRRFNFVNDRRWMTRFNDDALDLRLIRYCREDQFHFDADFSSPEAVDDMLLRSGWNEANTAFTLRLNRVHHFVKARREEQQQMGVLSSAAGIE